MTKRILLLFCISIVSQVAVAQWTFTLTTNANGAITVKKMGPYSTKAECERDRLQLIYSGSINLDIEYRRRVTISIKSTATPCTGPGGGSLGSVDLLGVDKGGSFFSINPVNEINDWSNDDMERMLALNPESMSIFKEPNTIATGDIAFDNLIENMPYSDEAFSGRMPRGSANIEADDNDNITAIGQPIKGEGIHVSDDFFDKPFDYGLGVWSSDDLKPLNVNLKPVRPLPYPIEETRISDFWFDLAGDVAKTAIDIYDISKVLAGTAATVTSAAAIGTAVLADVAINLFVEDAKAYYKVYKGESVTTGDIIKNTLEKSSMGLFKVDKNLSGYTKGVIGTGGKGVTEHFVKEGSYKIVGASNMEKGLAGPGVSIATRIAKYGNMIYDNLYESE